MYYFEVRLYFYKIHLLNVFMIFVAHCIFLDGISLVLFIIQYILYQTVIRHGLYVNHLFCVLQGDIAAKNIMLNSNHTDFLIVI